MDVLTWMALDVTVNLATGQAGMAVALPTLPTAMSVLGLVAAVATFTYHCRIPGPEALMSGTLVVAD